MNWWNRIGKTDLQLDKDAVDRLVSISKLLDDNKNYVLGLIDMALRDFKAKIAYSK